MGENEVGNAEKSQEPNVPSRIRVGVGDNLYIWRNGKQQVYAGPDLENIAKALSDMAAQPDIVQAQKDGFKQRGTRQQDMFSVEIATKSGKTYVLMYKDKKAKALGAGVLSAEVLGKLVAGWKAAV